MIVFVQAPSKSYSNPIKYLIDFFFQQNRINNKPNATILANKSIYANPCPVDRFRCSGFENHQQQSDQLYV